MNRRSRLVPLTLLLAACATGRPQFDVGLTKVERPANAKERYGETKITQIADSAGHHRYLFEDQLVSILWMPLSDQIAFYLTNKTDHSIKIVWDEAAYIDENQQSHRVMHNGVKYIDRNQSEPPTVVAGNSSFFDEIVPTDHVELVGGDWVTLPLVIASDSSAPSKVGKTLRALLPLSIEDVVNEYTFTFTIDRLVPRPKPLKY